MDDDRHVHDRGLAFDLSTLLARRRALQLMVGAGLATLIGCGSDAKEAATTSTSNASTSNASTTPSSTTSSSTTVADSTCAVLPEETAGPYPGDGSNGPNVLAESGIVRRDIRSSFGSASATAEGVPLTITLTVLDTANGCAPLAGGAVYLWHCDADGQYSMYSPAIEAENYLRGVQETDVDGRVTFTSIFPAAYSGRWPHIHFEVFPSLSEATSGGPIQVTSQLALPEDACTTVYATDGYAQSVRNLAQTSLDSDNVFSDGYADQLATVSGSVDEGYHAELSLSV